MDADLTLGGLDTLGQSVDRRGRLIQLSAAVVAHHHPVAAVLNRELHILRGQHPLNPNLHIRHAAQPWDLLRPRMRAGIERREPVLVALAPDHLRGLLQHRKSQPRRGAEVVAVLAVPHPQDRAVGRQEERLAPGGLGALDDALLLRPVLHRVDLHGVLDGADAQAGRADLLDRVVGEARHAHVDLVLCARAARRELAVRMRHGLETRGGDAERKADLLP